MMEKGLSKRWTPKLEGYYRKLLAGCRTFAERHLLMTVMDLLKYDGRTKEGKKAIARGRLRLATATDEELEELARLEQTMPLRDNTPSVSERVEELKRERAEVREKGIKKGELECQQKPRQ